MRIQILILGFKGLKAVCLYMKAWITTHEISIIIRGVQIIFISPCTAVRVNLSDGGNETQIEIFEMTHILN